MRPTIPPSVFVLLCMRDGEPLPQHKQAKMLGVSMRHMARLVAKSWDGWRVGLAVKWCSICGADFWDLHKSAQRLKDVRWDHAKSRHKRALEALIKEAGANPSAKRVRELAEALSS